MFVTSSSDSFPASLFFFLLDQYKRSKRETQPQLQPSSLWYNCPVNGPTYQNIAKPDQHTSCFNDNSSSFVTAMENQDTCPDLLFSNDTVDDCSGRMTITQFKSNNKLLRAHFARLLPHMSKRVKCTASHHETSISISHKSGLQCEIYTGIACLPEMVLRRPWILVSYLFLCSGQIYSNSPTFCIFSIQFLDPFFSLPIQLESWAAIKSIQYQKIAQETAQHGSRRNAKYVELIQVYGRNQQGRKLTLELVNYVKRTEPIRESK